MPARTPVTSIVAIPQDADRQDIVTAADHRPIWVSRPDPSDPAPLLAAFAEVPLRPAQFVWIAAEAGVARALRDAALARGVPADWLRAAGYWLAGTADASVKDL